MAYNTNPYDKEYNPNNTALGSKINSSAYFKLYFQRENICKNLGFSSGLTFIHVSNASLKSPNAGVNSWAATFGLNYSLKETQPVYPIKNQKEKYSEKIKYNFKFSFGANETDFIGSGIKPFFTLSAIADKRINKKSAFQFGIEWMVNYSLKEYIKIRSSINQINLSTDFNRIGLLAGHEWFISNLSVETQLGYYIYYPFDFEGRIYERLNMKYYLKNEKKWFVTGGIKAHAAKAETFAFGLGIRI